MSRLSKTILASALFGLALINQPAHAVDFSLVSSSDNAEVGYLLSVNLLGPATRDFSFELDLLGSTVANSRLDLSSLLVVSLGSSIEIFNATPDGVATTPTGFSATFPTVSLLAPFASFAPLTDGFYVARVTRGVLGLSVLTTLSAVATPVPEAQTYAMLLAGLGLVGTMVARRRKS